MKNKILKCVSIVVIWFIFWFLGQALFFMQRLPLPDMGGNWSFLIITVWTLLLATIALLIWKKKVNDFSFLKVKNKKIFWLYLIPAVCVVIILIKGAPVEINRFMYVLGIIPATFLAQDLPTFGFLQTYLEKIVSPLGAFIITSMAFFVGHLAFEISTLSIITMLGFFLFGYLRFKTRNIYLLNIIHLTFLLLPI